MNLRQRIARFLRGRYGVDKFGNFLAYTALALMLLNSFLHLYVIYILQLLLLFYWGFRCFSKNIYARQKENRVFEKIFNKFTSYFKLLKNKWKYRKTHVFAKCPGCKANIRLPRKKGEHFVNCPGCGKHFKFKCR